MSGYGRIAWPRVTICCGSSVQICTSGTIEMDELAVGREFTDFKSLSVDV